LPIWEKLVPLHPQISRRCQFAYKPRHSPKRRASPTRKARVRTRPAHSSIG
jgi:hypothetical protein